MAFSIRYKFLAVTTLLLAICLGTYLLLATYIFKEDKRSLVFDYNRSLVVNIASDLDNFFGGLSDKMQLVAFFHYNKDSASRELLKDLMYENKDIVWVGGSSDFKKLHSEFFVSEDYNKTYGLEKDFFSNILLETKPIPFEKIQRDGQAVWSATLEENGPALIGFGKNVIEENSHGIPVRQFAIIAYVRADRIIKALKESSPSESLVVSSEGEILAHPDHKILQDQKLQDVELFKKAKDLKMRAQVLKYTNNDDGRFGAFAKSDAGQIFVLSSISESKAFKAVNDLVFRSLLFGSILVTFAFLLAIFFSRSLTRPIETLAAGMKKVTDGHLDTNIQIKSKDEISSLASHFNIMIGEVKKSREELEEINKDLEKKVKERTVQLEERNQAVKEAQEALLKSTRLAAVGEVAGIAAHEVLNPLTSIISKLNDFKNRLKSDRKEEALFLLELKKSWEEEHSQTGFEGLVNSWKAPSQVQDGASLWQEDLSNIEKIGNNVLNEFDQLIDDSEFLIGESQRINRLIQSFRGMSAAKAEMKQFSVHSLCDRSISIMADFAAKYNVNIKKDFKISEDLVWVDEDEFIQVMTNLLRNGIQSIQEKDSRTESGEIVISTLESKSNPNNLIISIKDNGLGLTKENANKLFNNKFTTKSKAEGTGIGLSLSRRLARAFKGDLTLAWTEVSKGAEFHLAIPKANNVMEQSA